MKKLLLVTITLFTLAASAQRERSIERDEWVLSAGFNAINSLGTKKPFASPGDWAFKYPLTVGIESRISRLFTLDINLSINGFNAGEPLDAIGPPAEDLSYFAIDTAFKYYFGEDIFPDTEWIDLYGSLGVGLFTIEDSNISFNGGGGIIFWLDDSRRKNFGIRLQGLGKFAFNHENKDYVYPNNHFQYSIAALIRL
jgi:hypothetical protein